LKDMTLSAAERG